MVLNCIKCGLRARDDRSCRSIQCEDFRPGERGQHWRRQRLQQALGDLASKVGVFAVGGHILCLLHRPDVRCGVASRMFLQQLGFNLAQRLELLTTLYPAYWKWATSKILSGMVAKAQMLREATDRQRATIINQCWEAMVADQESQQVICRPAERKLTLLPRSETATNSRWRSGAGKRTYAYHSFRNPSSRRNGKIEWDILRLDVDSGKLRRACEQLASRWRCMEVTYEAALHILDAQDFAYLRAHDATYTKIRFVRWLIKCEGRQVIPSSETWSLLTGMGSGVKQGLDISGIASYEDALIACSTIASAGGVAEGREYSIDDLVCFHSMTQNKECEGIVVETLPPPPPPVSIIDDLVDFEGTSTGWNKRWNKALILPAVGGNLVRLEQALVVLFTVNLIRCLPMQGWAPLCQTCSLLKRITAPKFEPAQSHCTATCAAVSALIPRIARLFETGQLSAGALLKVKGHAFDLIEICAPCMTAISVEMLSVMILRFSVKYEMRKEDASVALGVLRVPEPGALAEGVECRILTKAMCGR